MVERRYGTHEVMNQPPPLEGYNLFEQDPALAESVEREGGAWGLDRLRRFGAMVGGEPLRLGVVADRNSPVLMTHDRASLLVRHSPPFVTDAFVASRVAGDHGMAFGTLPPGVDADAIIERHRPEL